MLFAALLPVLATPALPGAIAHAVADPGDPGYSLASTLSPAALSAADCAADARCVAAPAPISGDNYNALKAAVASAAALAAPAVVDGTGAVVTPAQPGTVFLAPGTYALARSLKLPPNVNLRGSGISATTLAMITSSWANFSYSFLVRWDDTAAVSPGSTNLVSDLTVNGNCREGAGAPVPADMPARPGELCDFRVGTGASTNVGGGISVADRWTVRQVRFTNLEYFKLWVNGVNDVRITDNRFDNWGGAESGDEDNIGGGGRNERAVIEYNQFDKTIRGNSMDFTNAIQTTIRANTVYTDPAVAAARGTEYGNLYMEGVPQATIVDNVMYGGHITLQSNSKYSHTGTNKDITNPRDSVVRGNRLINSTDAGVIISYDDYADADSSYGTLGSWTTSSTDPNDHVVRAGGNNVVADNVITNSRKSGVVIVGLMDRVKDTADTVTGNAITDAGFGNPASEANTGAGTFEHSGVGISIGNGDKVYGNQITDDQTGPTTWHGVHIGARNAVSTIKNTVLTGPAGETNTVAGIIGVPVRYAASAALAPTGLATTATGVTWTDSTPTTTAPIAGYRVYRNNVLVADQPVGSGAVPGNMVADADSTVDADASGWTQVSNTRIGYYNGAGALGSGSLSLTAVAAGQVNASGRFLSIVPGQTYTTTAVYRSLTGTGQRGRTGIEYYDANKTRLSRLATSNNYSVDNATGWITSWYTSTAPANAVYAKVFVLVDNTQAGDVHLVDRIGMVAGTGVQQWTDPAPASGTTYRVAAYRVGDGQPGWLSGVTAP
ncbi:hypothetical protein KRMM14A1004_29680 [Krasilnikovia sp. MM14-A1004]